MENRCGLARIVSIITRTMPNDEYYYEEEWESLAEDDPENMDFMHGIGGCLEMHDSEKEIESIDLTGVTILIDCPKCGTRQIHYEKSLPSHHAV